MVDLCKKNIEGVKEEMLIDQWKVISHKFKHFVKSKDFLKIYRVVSEKRRIVGNDTLPFGYCD